MRFVRFMRPCYTKAVHHRYQSLLAHAEHRPNRPRKELRHGVQGSAQPGSALRDFRERRKIPAQFVQTYARVGQRTNRLLRRAPLLEAEFEQAQKTARPFLAVQRGTEPQPAAPDDRQRYDSEYQIDETDEQRPNQFVKIHAEYFSRLFAHFVDIHQRAHQSGEHAGHRQHLHDNQKPKPQHAHW